MSEISGTSTIALAPARERDLGRALVDLGLAAAGDAVQQELREAAGLDRRRDLGQRARWCAGELGRGGRLDQWIDAGRAHDLALLAEDEARFDQRAQRRARTRRRRRRAERLQELELPRRARERLPRAREVEPGRAPVHALGARAHARRVGRGAARHHSESLEPRQRGHRRGKARAQLGLGARALAERPQHARERAAQLPALERAHARGQERHPRAGSRRGAGRHRGGERHSRRTERVVRRAQHHLEQLRGQHRLVVQHLQHAAQRPARARLRAGLVRDHDPDQPPPAVRHQHARARLRALAVAERVVEGLLDRHGHRDFDDGEFSHRTNVVPPPLPAPAGSPTKHPCATSPWWGA